MVLYNNCNMLQLKIYDTLNFINTNVTDASY